MKSFKVLLTIFSLLSVLIFFSFVEESWACIFLYVLLGIVVYISCGTQQTVLYNTGMLLVIIFLTINKSIYGGYLLLSQDSDDFMYETYGLGFEAFYGIDFRYIYDYIGILHNSAGYVYIISLLAYFARCLDGYHHFLPIILNVFLLNVTGSIVSKVARHYNANEIVIKKGNVLWSLYPCLIHLVSFVFRDMVVGFLMVLIYYQLIINNNIIKRIIIIGICLLSLYYLRFQAFLMCAFLVVLFQFNIEKINTKTLLLLIPALFAFMWVVNTYNIDDKITSYTELRAETGGGIMNRMMNLPIYIGIIPRLCVLSITPFVVPEVTQAIAGISGILQLFFTPIIIKALFNTKVDMKLKMTFLLFFIGVSISTFTFRHVCMYLPFAFVLCMVDWRNQGASKGLMKYVVLYGVMWIVSLGLLLI
ncbi:MAG: hypothetical protein IKR33_06860 [Bacteroidales bacterium]|nr:hypothetical protein [Bacteroidales bacterium]